MPIPSIPSTWRVPPVKDQRKLVATKDSKGYDAKATFKDDKLSCPNCSDNDLMFDGDDLRCGAAECFCCTAAITWPVNSELKEGDLVKFWF